MEFFERMAIEHADHAFMNPISPAKVDEFVDLLDLPDGSRVLDVGAKSLVVPLLILPQLVHYVLDGFVWRRRDNPQLA